MSFLSALFSLVADVLAFIWFSLFEPPVNNPDEAGAQRPDTPGHSTTTLRVDETPPQVLSPAREEGMLVPRMYRRDADVAVEDSVNEASFLSQLEQRTQQVKITLANLEAEKVRIEGLIAHLQPVVPHYDALLEAERAISNANVPIEAAQAASVQSHRPSQEQPLEAPHGEPAESGWSQ